MDLRKVSSTTRSPELTETWRPLGERFPSVAISPTAYAISGVQIQGVQRRSRYGPRGLPRRDAAIRAMRGSVAAVSHFAKPFHIRDNMPCDRPSLLIFISAQRDN